MESNFMEPALWDRCFRSHILLLYTADISTIHSFPHYPCGGIRDIPARAAGLCLKRDRRNRTPFPPGHSRRVQAQGKAFPVRGSKARNAWIHGVCHGVCHGLCHRILCPRGPFRHNSHPSCSRVRSPCSRSHFPGRHSCSSRFRDSCPRSSHFPSRRSS